MFGPCEKALILPGIEHCSYRQVWNAIAQDSPISVCIVGLDGQWLYSHRKIGEWLGYSPAELEQINFQSVTYPDDLQADLEQMQRMINRESNSYQLEKRYLSKTGEPVWARLTVTALVGECDRVVAFVSQIENIQERKEQERRLKDLTLTDPLTGLGNRRRLESELERQWRLMQRKGTPFGLIMIDVDQFKSINDLRGGHPCGDAVLQDIAGKLESSVRVEDVVARISGDEFAVIMPDTVEVHTAIRRIEKTLNSSVEYQGDTIPYQCSVGGVVCTQSTRSISEAYAAADKALYEKKRSRKALSLLNSDFCPI